MRLLFLFIGVLATVSSCSSQKSIPETLERFNDASVPYISVHELKATPAYIILDTREKEEYDISHLRNAIWVGHKNFKIEEVVSQFPNPQTPIVVYCSVGVRSEFIGEKLQRAGFTHIKNLYGGIFEWKNQGNPVYDNLERETEKVHAYSKNWGALLTKGEKVYSTKPKKLDKSPE